MSFFPADKIVPDPHELPRARASRIEREHREALQSLAEATERHRAHNDKVAKEQRESSGRWQALSYDEERQVWVPVTSVRAKVRP